MAILFVPWITSVLITSRKSSHKAAVLLNGRTFGFNRTVCSPFLSSLPLYCIRDDILDFWPGHFQGRIASSSVLSCANNFLSSVRKIFLYLASRICSMEVRIFHAEFETFGICDKYLSLCFTEIGVKLWEIKGKGFVGHSYSLFYGA